MVGSALGLGAALTLRSSRVWAQNRLAVAREYTSDNGWCAAMCNRSRAKITAARSGGVVQLLLTAMAAKIRASDANAWPRQ
jgi:hypothetical protein